MSNTKTFFCLTCEFKGGDFLKACSDEGNHVILVTAKENEKEPWPFEAIDEIFYIPERDGRLWKIEDLKKGLAYLFREKQISRIIALDDYDVSKAAALREEFRMPGMGQTTARHFYDKLAMRMIADKAGIPIPRFSSMFNNVEIGRFLDQTEGPWVVKPRSDAGAHGIRKLQNAEEFWALSDSLGDHRHEYLIEEFKPGSVCHIDSLSFYDEILFSRSSQYLTTPFEVAHGGGIFRSATIEINSALDNHLKELNARVLKAFGLKHGATHSEFIDCGNGELYFLETSARVGGANLAELVEASSGINLWREWAKIETALLNNKAYELPAIQNSYAGIVQSLSKYEQPDYRKFLDPEIVWRLEKEHHIGMIVRSGDRDRVIKLLDQYADIIHHDFHASVPLKE